MSENKSNNIGLKVILGILLALILGIGYFSYDMYNKNKVTVSELNQEKESVLADLNAMNDKYSLALSENDIANENLVLAQERVQGLIDSLQKSETNVKNLMGYVSKYKALQKEMTIVLKENDLLKVENKNLTTSLDSTNIQLEERKMFGDSLTVQNNALANVVETASVLNTAKLKAEGVIVRNSGKIIETDKASRSDKLRICFTVTKNSLVNSGDKAFFVQVMDPSNNILGENAKVMFGEQSLNYSLISTFNYNSKDLDICEFIVKGEKEDFNEGNYKVNIFDKSRLVSSSIFTLE
ncbi:chromosome partitioning protein ParA [Aurantibacter sp.]|uniref:chromosome partitioning protein ParA n=1 Tax=Aurantibacter sp. TaxID=2807103 RepID=UPI0035C7A71C